MRNYPGGGPPPPPAVAGGGGGGGGGGEGRLAFLRIIGEQMLTSSLDNFIFSVDCCKDKLYKYYS